MSRIHDALKKAEREKAEGLNRAPGETPFPLQQPNVPPERGLAGGGGSAASGDLLRFGDLRMACSAPGWIPDPSMCVFAGQGAASLSAEQFRTLRARLHQIRSNRPLRTLLVASAIPAEGKTFVASNLAQALVQQSDQRTLLIDTDLRRPRQHLLLGAPASPGLSDFLRGTADLFSVIQRGPIGNLFLIPAGSPSADAGELVANARLKSLLDRLAPVFDWIILDSPPVLSVSDASVLAAMCDGVILVVRAGSTDLEAARRAAAEFQGKNLLGVVLNSVAESAAYGGYYYAYQSVEKSSAT